jgi:hypothetical protein
MRLIPILALLALVGCHTAESVVPAPSPVVVIPAVAACVPFTLDWRIDRSLAQPSVTIWADAAQIAVEDVGQAAPPAVFPVSFGTHRVRGLVGSCWSEWHAFAVSPNPVGPVVIPPLPPPVCPNPAEQPPCD